ncbi:hypothetical protein J1780_19485 [Rahnella aceris]|uniref:hypothetical protein n=1 Tax=Rahnella sp. (strain Y9602) TaxID=2703885 RepID=UPI001C26776E|nr:hypothetical protein [Rahnella aceris]MBU9842135.1 hypothetical protein [Rahnella aceris]
MIVNIYKLSSNNNKLLITESELYAPSLKLPIDDNEKLELLETVDTRSKSFKYNAELVETSLGSIGYLFVAFI